jgi:hypothetical protein
MRSCKLCHKDWPGEFGSGRVHIRHIMNVLVLVIAGESDESRLRHEVINVSPPRYDANGNDLSISGKVLARSMKVV